MSAPIRLERETPAARQAGCALVIGVFLAVLGGIVTMAMRSGEPSAGSNEWVVYAVGGGFLLVGLVLVIAGIKMALATRVPETIVEVDRKRIHAGDPFRVTVRQTGPIRLRSLRLNLVGEQLTRRDVWSGGKRRTDTDRRLIHQHNVVDVRELTILPGEELVRQGQATVPAEVTLADIEGDKRVVWRLEVWGRVRGWVDFAHSFVIEVSAHANRPQTPDR
jgi:hypothetical protein